VKIRFLKLSALLLAAVTLAPKLYAQDQPRIIGMAHMAYYVSDLKQARDYYEGFLGFEEVFTLKNQDGTDHVVFIKINDHQFIELYAEPVKNYGFVHDAGFETNHAKGTFTSEDNAMSKLLLSVMGAFAEFERSLIRERQREGIAIAKKAGVYKGRKPSLTPERVAELRARVAAGEKRAALAREFGISRETLYQYAPVR
jgi:catechol 2,3-dioxygenase-like lactoylglutathione lyase family enzyme